MIRIHTYPREWHSPWQQNRRIDFMHGRPKSDRRSVAFELRLREEMREALRDMARQKFTTPTEYVRQALLAKLEHDGICLVAVA